MPQIGYQLVNWRREGIPGRHEPHLYRTNLRHTEGSLPDRCIQYTSLRYTVQPFMKPCFKCTIKKVIKYFNTVANSVTKDYNYLLIVMNSVFDYSFSGLQIKQIKTFLRGKQDIWRKNSVMNFIRSVIIFSLVF